MVNQEPLFEHRTPEYRVPSAVVDPFTVKVNPTDKATFVGYQRRMSSATWNPAPGRFLPFLVSAELGYDGSCRRERKVVGIINLNTPIMNLGPRDKYLGLPKDMSERGYELVHYPDMGTCIGAQPLAWYWNIGKLLAMITPTLGDFWMEKYGDEMKGVTTTSVYGKSSQYNRVWKHLGYTKGHGHEHYNDEEIEEFREYLKARGALPMRRGRMDLIQAYRRESGDKTITTFHGRQRGIYYHEALPPDQREDQIMSWFGRWGKPRYDRVRDRKPPYEQATVPSKGYRISEEGTK